MNDDDLRALLERLDTPSRGAIRRVLVRDQEYRDAMASRLFRYGSAHSANLADLIDMLTIDDDARRRIARVLGELEATS